MSRQRITTSCLVVLLCCVSTETHCVADQQPNIVLILADDMGYSDVGCYGGEIQTPHLDRMAAGGLRFTQFYNGAKCCPTRAALLTGLYSHRAGMGGMVRRAPGEAESFSPYQGYLNKQAVTAAEMLRGAGYQTLMSGKWHVGEHRPHWPRDRGFERYFGLISGASSYWELSPWAKMARDDRDYRPPDDGTFYMTDALSDAAVNYIQEHGRREKPFFLYLSYTAPHAPLHAYDEDIAKYRETYLDGWDTVRSRRLKRMRTLGLAEASWKLSESDAPDWDRLSPKSQQDLALKMAIYAAMVDRMDQGIGRVLNKLRELDIEQQTLVLFLSDNGGNHVDRNREAPPNARPGSRQTFAYCGQGWANASNTPFRRYKRYVHEGGIATPLIAYWPGVIAPGTITRQVGHVIDLFPTFQELAGSDLKPRSGKDAAPKPDGLSLVSVLKGKRHSKQRTLFWENQGHRAVRAGDWKLVAVKGGDWELYDLGRDLTEMKNLVRDYPEKVRELSGLFRLWSERVGVDLGTSKQ